MVGALSQTQNPSPSQDPYDQSGVDRPPGWARPLLNRATESLLQDLTQRAPYEAQAAAMFSQGPRGSLAGALGAGIGANLQTRLGMLQLPFQIREQAARSRLEEEQARRFGLENLMTELNFGYMTAPWGSADEFAQPPAEGTPSPQGGAPPAGPGPGAQPPAAMPLGSPTAGPAAGGPVDQPQQDPNQLPLTDQSRQRLDLLQGQYERARRYANRSPQARQDLLAISNEMTQTVANDPLAKNALELRKTSQGADIDLNKQLRLKAADLMKESQAAAQEEFKAIATNPNSQLDPAVLSDPSLVQNWIDKRAQQIFSQRYGVLARQMTAAGMNPHQYLGEQPVTSQPLPEQGTPQPMPQGAPQPQEQPQPDDANIPKIVVMPKPQQATLPDGTPIDMPVRQPQGPAASVKPPARIPDLPPLKPEQQQQVNKLAASEPPPSPFTVRQLTPEERVKVNAEQENQGRTVNTLAQWYANLQRGLDLNDKSYSGRIVELQSELARGRATIWQLFTGKERPEEYLTNTSELQSILSGLTLQNLQAYIKGRMTNFELEYIQQLESSLDMSKQERQRLLERGLQIVRPRLAFEEARAHALSRGQYIDENSYEDWFRKSYGVGSPFDLSGPRPKVQAPGE